MTGLGPVKIKQPRVDDRKLREKYDGEKFTSDILPRYMRGVASVDNLIPALYLKGISTQDFPAALSAILGEDARNISANTVVRLKQKWTEEYEEWCTRDLSEKQYVYIWADGIHFKVRLDKTSSCILVILGADRDGNKELLAVSDGYRESKLSRQNMLLDLKRHGMQTEPCLAIGDGGLGFWAALREEFPNTAEQRCWVHKTANILDKLAKGVQSTAKELIHEMYMANTRKEALDAYQQFIKVFDSKYPQAVKCLTKDFDRLFTFYDFPGDHWVHIRTTNPIESTFATVRLRTKRTKGCGSRAATLMMVFKLVKEAEKRWRKIRGFRLLEYVLDGEKFVDGEAENEEPRKVA